MDDAVENRQISHDPEHGFLLRTYDMRGADKFRRLAKFGVNTRCGHLRRCFTAPDQCPRAGPNLKASKNYPFARLRRLRDSDRWIEKASSSVYQNIQKKNRKAKKPKIASPVNAFLLQDYFRNLLDAGTPAKQIPLLIGIFDGHPLACAPSD
jgi:hypothetical protein